MKFTLYDYQVAGVERLKEGNCLLLDEMGLGKTIQAVEAAGEFSPCRIVVICPVFLRNMWKSAFDNGKKQLSVKVISYNEAASAKPEDSDILIVDEAHYIKNRNSLRAKGVKAWAKKAEIKWILTGTPIMNHAGEIWNLLHIAFPTVFKSYWEFINQWANTKYTPFGNSVRVVPGVKDPQGYAKMLSRYAIRRTKADVGLQLPKVTLQTIDIDMTSEQKRLQKSINKELLTQMESGDILTVQNAAMRTLRLQQLAVCPSWLGSSDEGCKLPILKNILETTEDRPIVFCTWLTPLRQVKAHVDGFILHGEMSEKERDALINTWKKDPKKRPLYTTIGAGGVGLTLTESSLCVFLNEPWVPAQMQQAIGRLDRIGQTRPITVIILRASNSIETLVASRLGDKQAMVSAIDRAIREGNW